MHSGSILVVPALEKGRGGGHLVRSSALVRSLRSQNREAYLFAQTQQAFLLHTNNFDASWLISDENMLKSRSWDFIVLDCFQTPPDEFEGWAALAPLIGVDEGGMLRDNFDFLIDLLPLLPDFSVPNILAPSLLPLPLPQNRRTSFFSEQTDRPLKILVSFGAEDPAGLTIPVCRALVSSGNAEITTLFGGLNQLDPSMSGLEGLRVLGVLPELREHLAEYDLVITHFGLTAFECIYARVPVLLVSPGEYHEKLAINAGFISAGIGPKSAEKLKELVYNNDFLKNLRVLGERLSNQYGLTEKRQSLGELLGAYIPYVPPVCPACGSQDRCKHPVLARFPERTYRRCPDCGMAYMLRPSPPPIEYERDYFFDLYKKQYGKTYLEDFPNLIRNGKTRLAHIKGILQSRQTGVVPQLLDIGCAYGPFLAAAKEEGFSPTGIDPAEDAVRYVREVLQIPGFRGFFPDTPLPDVLSAESFDAISLWYVIEHFENPGLVLQEIHRLLKSGGVLAFSTPSFSGVSRRTSLKGFLEKSPPDHWTIWEPRYTGAVLKKYGFTLKKIVISGHHPERFPLVGTMMTRKQGFLYRFCLGISRWFGLGDTFEVYAVKA
ncbi:MAG: methyltransferase domain-containing protein [Treponema sp.]|jgi:SAM-dependent methyltransferase/spore coat polysaccharide biosynthesis predicted glycosyltransferase SpsG|nr:methyltransferase domain-containing protein [Treponema sp.]